MLSFYLVVVLWIAPLAWLMRLANREIRAAQKFHVGLPPKIARQDEKGCGPAKLLLVEPADRREGEHVEVDAERLPQAA